MPSEYRKVSKAEFDSFLSNYPKPLEHNACHISDPPTCSYNDFSNGKIWPESIVAKYRPDDRSQTITYFLRAEEDHFLDSDNDGHWYIIPANKRHAWEDWVDSNEPETPDFVEPINGCPSRVVFKEYINES